MDTTFKKNLIYLLSSVLRGMALLCVTGPIMQTFIESCSFGSEFNYFYSALLQAINVIVIVFSSRFGDKGNIFKRTSFTSVFIGALFLIYTPVCLAGNTFAGSAFLLILGGSLQTVGIGLFTACEYKLPYHIFLPNEFGPMLALCGISGSVISMLFSGAITYFSALYDYKLVMLFAFFTSSICMFFSGVLLLFLKPHSHTKKEPADNGENNVSLFFIFRQPIFYKLVIPNLLRGVASGITTVLTVLAFRIGYSEKVATLMVTLQSIAMFLGTSVFGFLANRINHRKLILIGSLTFLLLPAMLLNNTPMFLTAYSVILCGRTIADNAVPTLLFEIVPSKIAGPYNAWRMILHTIGSVIGTLVTSILSPTFSILITVLFQMLFALMYFCTKETKQKII